MPSAKASSVSSKRATQRSPTQPSDTRVLRASLGTVIRLTHELGFNHLSVATQAEKIFHPAAQLSRQRQGNLRGRDRLARFDRAERLSTDTDGLGQIPLLHFQPLPHGLDRGSNPGVHAGSIAKPDLNVN